jgi:hypothetical protein
LPRLTPFRLPHLITDASATRALRLPVTQPVGNRPRTDNPRLRLPFSSIAIPADNVRRMMMQSDTGENPIPVGQNSIAEILTTVCIHLEKATHRVFSFGS